MDKDSRTGEKKERGHRERREDKPAARTPARGEIEIAYYTKELGRPLQREMLQAQLDLLNEEGRIAPAHRLDPAQDSLPPSAAATPSTD